MPVLAQANNPGKGWLKHGASFIGPDDLPWEFAAVLKKMGGRLSGVDNALVTIAGTYSEAGETQQVQVSVQAPGYLRFEETGKANPRILTFDGSQFQVKNGKGGQNDMRVQESLMAYMPDTLLLQIAEGGGLRRIGSNFRTDNGKTPNYTGPYWTLYEFTPADRPGLAKGQALQQGIFIAIDQRSALISEVRVVSKAPGAPQSVTQTKFNNWLQQNGQWYPGEIVRLENGSQVAKLTTQQGVTGAQISAASIGRP